MATILVGRVQLLQQAQEVVEQLTRAGFASGKIASFYLNPPGQHALYPIGGDRFQSPGTGTAAGSTFEKVVETIIGIDTDKQDADSEPVSEKSQGDDAVPLRKAGMLVAVELNNDSDQDHVVAILRKSGAFDIEKAEGEIVDGDWRDFDILSTPCYL